MERIDRLIIKAKKAARAKIERFIMGFVRHDPDKGKYTACGHLWNGKKDAGCRYVNSEHDHREGAVDALKALANEYPNTVEDAVIFIGDIED